MALRVMVVDDALFMRNMLKDIFVQAGGCRTKYTGRLQSMVSFYHNAVASFQFHKVRSGGKFLGIITEPDAVKGFITIHRSAALICCWFLLAHLFITGFFCMNVCKAESKRILQGQVIVN